MKKTVKSILGLGVALLAVYLISNPSSAYHSPYAENGSDSSESQRLGEINIGSIVLAHHDHVHHDHVFGPIEEDEDFEHIHEHGHDEDIEPIGDDVDRSDLALSDGEDGGDEDEEESNAILYAIIAVATLAVAVIVAAFAMKGKKER